MLFSWVSLATGRLRDSRQSQTNSLPRIVEHLGFYWRGKFISARIEGLSFMA